jgi:hypothetical protein
MAPDHLKSKIKLVFGESLPDRTARRKNKFNNNGKKEKDDLPSNACPLLLIVRFIGSVFIGAAAQTPPQDCNKCIVIEYQGEHTAIIAGVESFTNMTTRLEQYNSHIWQFIDSLVSDGFEIKSVMMYEEGDDSTDDMYHVFLAMP